MPLPSMLQSDSFKRLAQGAAVGAVATMIIGFSWGGWSVESTAAKRADEASRTAVVAALAPFVSTDFNAPPMRPIISSNSRKCPHTCREVLSKKAAGRHRRVATRLTQRSLKPALPCWEI